MSQIEISFHDEQRSDVPLIVEDLLVEAEDAAFLGDDLVLAGELWASAVELLRGGS